MLILLLCFYMLVAHWLACIWYSIGRSDADNGVQYSWLWKLANVTQSPYAYVWSNHSNSPELVNGPARKTMYVTALYFTMTCMTSVGFGNVAAETDNEKIFTTCMMIIGCELVLFFQLTFQFVQIRIDRVDEKLNPNQMNDAEVDLAFLRDTLVKAERKLWKKKRISTTHSS